MKKKILAFGIALCMLFGFAIVPTYAATSGTCGDNLTWTLDDNGTLTISGSGAMANYSEESFVPWRGRSVKTVVIESSVTSIGDRAFYKCSSLESITIPDSVTSIERYAFAGCSSLTSITIPAGVTTIGYKAFYNTAYYNDDSKWENGVLYINNHIIAAKTDVTSITIKPETRTIAVAAFRGCSDLKSITIPNSVAIIGDYAFAGCSSLAYVNYGGTEEDWNKIIISSKNDYLLNSTKHYEPSASTGIVGSGPCGKNVKWILDNEGTLTISGDGDMTNYLYAYSSSATWYSWRLSIETVVIQSGVTSIGDYMFKNCNDLTSIEIPDSVTSIGDFAFLNCSSLISITIPDSVTKIGEGAFYKCSSLKSITIPNSVAIIGDYAFYECSSLTSITIPNSVAIIGDSAFYKCSSLISITIPDSVTSIERYAFAGCSSLTSITIPDSVTTIGAVAFGDCSSLTDVYYSGTEEDWNKISIDSGNYDLTNATRHHIPALSVARDENTFTVMPKNVEAGSIILTTYKNGAVTELKTAEYDGEPAEFTVTSDYDSIKIMLWNSFNDMQPLVSAKKQ